MKLQIPKNPNYCCTVVEINKLVPIEKRDRIQSAIIFSNSVIVSKDLELNTKGLFFPVETQISNTFLSKHNLFKDKTKNIDNNISQYFEDNGRVKCVKMGGAKSEGFFIPFHSLYEDYKELLELPIGTDFDYYNDERICRKYTIVDSDTNKEKKIKEPRQGKAPKFNKLVDNQFHFHIDTANARRNFHKISPEDIISITDKWHGTSAVFSNILTKRKLKLNERILSALGVNINDTLYDNIYSSRAVVKNKFEEADLIDKIRTYFKQIKYGIKDVICCNFKLGYDTLRRANSIFKYQPKEESGFYSANIWKEVNEQIKHLIPEGITIYGEIVGYIPVDKTLNFVKFPLENQSALEVSLIYVLDELLKKNPSYDVWLLPITRTDLWNLLKTEDNSFKLMSKSQFSKFLKTQNLCRLLEPIQQGYNYNCPINTYRFIVYRITNINYSGVVTEYSWQQIKDFCNKYGLDYAREFYYGYAKNLYHDISLDGEVRNINDVEEHLSWNDLVLERLNTDFNMEKECKYNKGFFAEGIVIRPDKLFDCVPLKLKSFGFLSHETRILDTGEEDIESEESVNEEESE